MNAIEAPSQQHTCTPLKLSAVILLLGLLPFASAVSDTAKKQDSFGTLVNSEQPGNPACLRASTTDDKLSLGPCPAGKDDDALAQWAARSTGRGILLVNRSRAADGTERCLVNYQWTARMGRCDQGIAESQWVLRDTEAGYVSLQNSYPSESRCLKGNAGVAQLLPCAEQPEATALWSMDILPRDPEYKQEHPLYFPQTRELKLASLPSAKAERSRLKQSMLWADWQPTGFYLNAFTPLPVTVQGNVGNATLELLVGTPSLVLPWNHNQSELEPLVKKLVPGLNTITTPRGGLISIRLVDDEPSGSTVEVNLGQPAQPIPFFIKGKTLASEWARMLDYSTIPLAQMVSDKVILASSLASMRSAAEAAPETLLDAYQQGIDAQNVIAGLSPETASVLRPLVVETRADVNPSATDYRAMLPFPASRELNTGGAKASWRLWHELGHQRQSPIWTWNDGSLGEVTVNVYTLAALRYWFGDDFPVPEGGPSPAHWDKATIYLAAPDEDRELENLEKVENAIIFAMFEQLRVAFGDGFYHTLERAVRTLSDPGTVPGRKQLFQVEASKAAHADLSDFFIKWGMRPDAKTLAAISALGLDKPKEDPTRLPVFKGSDKDRLLRLWGFWLPDGDLHVDGYAAPVDAHIQVKNYRGSWPEIAGVDQHLQFQNDHLTSSYLADGKQQLEARVKGNPDTLKFNVVQWPEVVELSAVRTAKNKIWIKGRAVPHTAMIEASNQDGSWPGVASVDAQGNFENDHLGNNHLVDGQATFMVRMAYADRSFKERTSVAVAQMLELSGQLGDGKALRVKGKAAPPGATVEALNENHEWVGIQSVGADGTFSNNGLDTRYLSDGKATLEARLRLPDGRLTMSMTVTASKAATGRSE
ncbi:MAG: M60 family metallopeptidase [Pseudomonas sp.]